MSAYVQHYDSILIEGEKSFKKYNDIWDKVISNMKIF